MANPKLLWPLLKSILDPKKRVVANWNRHLLKNRNRQDGALLTRREDENEISVQTGPENMKNASDDGEPQIATVAPEVNSLSQEANFGALEPPSPQEPKPKGGDLFTRREEKKHFLFTKVQKK